jgi:predicted anti-sigma-YlaC factor YlaD
MSAIGVSPVCQRVRSQVSLRLDNEISHLEGRMLDVHLGRCAQCRAYAADLTTFTRDLRAAPLEILARPVFVERGRRWSVVRLQGRVAASAAAVVAIVAIGVAAQVASSGQSETQLSNLERTVTRYPTQAELDRELAIFESLPTRRTASTGSTPL